MTNRKIVTIAARNARPGDVFYTMVGTSRRERRILSVSRVDYEDRICVRLSWLDSSYVVPQACSCELKLYHTIQVRRGENSKVPMSWEPCYYDTTNRKKPLPLRVRKLFGIR